MKITVDKKEGFTLHEWHKLLIKNDIPADIFDEDMIRRSIYCIESPIYKRLDTRKDLLCKALKEVGVKEIPSSIDKLAEFVGSRKDMGLKTSEMVDGCSLECDSFRFYTVSHSILTLVKSFVKVSELQYINDQLSWVFNEKIKGCLRRMHSEWDPKLGARNINLPLDNEEFVNLVTSQSDYKDRSAKDRVS